MRKSCDKYFFTLKRDLSDKERKSVVGERIEQSRIQTKDKIELNFRVICLAGLQKFLSEHNIPLEEHSKKTRRKIFLWDIAIICDIKPGWSEIIELEWDFWSLLSFLKFLEIPVDQTSSKWSKS